MHFCFILAMFCGKCYQCIVSIDTSVHVRTIYCVLQPLCKFYLPCKYCHTSVSLFPLVSFRNFYSITIIIVSSIFPYNLLFSKLVFIYDCTSIYLTEIKTEMLTSKHETV